MYNSVTFTETVAVTRNNPVSPNLPETFVECLLNVVSPDVSNVMTMEGIQSFLLLFVRTALFVISENCDAAERFHELEQAILESKVIERFYVIPDTWVVSQHNRVPSHEFNHAYEDSIKTNERRCYVFGAVF